MRGMATLLLTALLAAGGCATDPKDGYSFQSTFGADIKTVTVPIFDNYTYTPELPVDITEAVIKELQRMTPWAVTDAEHADATLSGVVRSIEMKKLSADPDSGLVQEMAVTVVIDFDLRDNRSGKVLVSRRRFAGVDTFVPTRGTGERLEVGQRAAVGRMSRDIVGELRADW